MFYYYSQIILFITIYLLPFGYSINRYKNDLFYGSYINNTGSVYFLAKAPNNFTTAVEMCTNLMGGFVIRLTDITEMEDLMKVYKSHKHVWLDMKVFNSSHYKRTDNKYFRFVDFSTILSGEKSNDDCGYLQMFRGKGNIHFGSCDYLREVLCEVKNDVVVTANAYMILYHGALLTGNAGLAFCNELLADPKFPDFSQLDDLTTIAASAIGLRPDAYYWYSYNVGDSNVCKAFRLDLNNEQFKIASEELDCYSNLLFTACFIQENLVTSPFQFVMKKSPEYGSQVRTGSLLYPKPISDYISQASAAPICLGMMGFSPRILSLDEEPLNETAYLILDYKTLGSKYWLRSDNFVDFEEMSECNLQESACDNAPPYKSANDCENYKYDYTGQTRLSTEKCGNALTQYCMIYEHARYVYNSNYFLILFQPIPKSLAKRSCSRSHPKSTIIDCLILINEEKILIQYLKQYSYSTWCSQNDTLIGLLTYDTVDYNLTVDYNFHHRTLSAVVCRTLTSPLDMQVASYEKRYEDIRLKQKVGSMMDAIKCQRYHNSFKEDVDKIYMLQSPYKGDTHVEMNSTHIIFSKNAPPGVYEVSCYGKKIKLKFNSLFLSHRTMIDTVKIYFVAFMISLTIVLLFLTFTILVIRIFNISFSIKQSKVDIDMLITLDLEFFSEKDRKEIMDLENKYYQGLITSTEYNE